MTKDGPKSLAESCLLSGIGGDLILGIASKTVELCHMSPLRGTHRFGIKGNLAPRFVGPFRILETRGPLAFRLELLESLAMLHDLFHVSQLKQ